MGSLRSALPGFLTEVLQRLQPLQGEEAEGSCTVRMAQRTADEGRGS